MQVIGNIVIYILMACMMAGCIGAVIRPDKGIGFEFLEGLRQLSTIFIPVAGVMAALPYMKLMIQAVFTRISALVGNDIAMWAGILLPPDMGGNLLTYDISGSQETWIIALFTCFILGSGVTYGIPMSINMVDKKDHKYMAMGILCGLMACPIGITVSCFLCMLTSPSIREFVSTVGEPTGSLRLTVSVIAVNLIPVYLICGLIGLGMTLMPEKMVKMFLKFGQLLNGTLYIIFGLSVVEYFTGLCSTLWSGWGFEPIIADAADYNRALETAGYCALMLAGAYPMMYLLQRFLGERIVKAGEKLGISELGCLGLIASAVSLVAIFRNYSKMPDIDKVRCIAWSLCGGYFLADHLVYCYNYQPNLYGCLLIGKLAGGICAMLLVEVLIKRRLAKGVQNEQTTVKIYNKQPQNL